MINLRENVWGNPLWKTPALRDSVYADRAQWIRVSDAVRDPVSFVVRQEVWFEIKKSISKEAL